MRRAYAGAETAATAVAPAPRAPSDRAMPSASKKSVSRCRSAGRLLKHPPDSIPLSAVPRSEPRGRVGAGQMGVHQSDRLIFGAGHQVAVAVRLPASVHVPLDLDDDDPTSAAGATMSGRPPTRVGGGEHPEANLVSQVRFLPGASGGTFPWSTRLSPPEVRATLRSCPQSVRPRDSRHAGSSAPRGSSIGPSTRSAAAASASGARQRTAGGCSGSGRPGAARGRSEG